MNMLKLKIFLHQLRWSNEGTISNKISVERRLKHIKITADDLLQLDRAVFKTQPQNSASEF
jgi:hypothetical protein